MACFVVFLGSFEFYLIAFFSFVRFSWGKGGEGVPASRTTKQLIRKKHVWASS